MKLKILKFFYLHLDAKNENCFSHTKVHWVGGWMMEVKAILKGILKTIKKVWWEGEWM